MTRRSIFYGLCFSAMLGACNGDQSKSYDSSAGLDEDKISRYEEMGKSGIGLAYEWLHADAEIHQKAERLPYLELALSAGSCPANTNYALRVLKESRKDAVSDAAKLILVEEAKKRAETAISNAFLYPETEGGEKQGLDCLKFASDTLEEINQELNSL